jgi:TetR/AcrR family transcriptional repressor of nem operon
MFPPSIVVAEAVSAAFGVWQRQEEAAESGGKPLSFAKLIDEYVSDGHRKNPGAGCAFSALAPEIARSDKRTRALTSEQVRKDIELIVELLPGKDKRAARSRAILTFSALVGAMSLARAVSDEALSHEILKTVEDLLKNPA